MDDKDVQIPEDVLSDLCRFIQDSAAAAAAVFFP